jgi:hydroxyacylglutathione hydrolase
VDYMDNYKIEEIASNTYRIDESGISNCYLLIGSEQALLIDACWGIGNLKRCITKITNQPIIVAVTHRHPDHTNGTRQFGDYYAHIDDNTWFNRFLEHIFLYRLALKHFGIKGNINQKLERGKILTMEDGDIFHLGNRDIEVKLIPGHTAGSVMFIDHSRKLLFTGDNINSHLWMHMPGAVSLEEWLEGTKLVLSYLEKNYTAYVGHGEGLQTKHQVEAIYVYAQEIIEKKKRGNLTKADNPYPRKGSSLEIRFNMNKIIKK